MCGWVWRTTVLAGCLKGLSFGISVKYDVFCVKLAKNVL